MFVETQIERLSQFGEGVGRVDGRSVFVDEAAPGDRALVEVHRQGKILRGRVVRLLEAGPSRRASRCPLSQTCGGCDWLHLEDAAQLEAKKEIVLSSLERIGGISRQEFRLKPIDPAPRAWNYRRRAVLHWVNGQLGFFERRSHRAVPIEECPALVPSLAALPGKLTEALQPIGKDIERITLIEAGSEVALSVEVRGSAKKRHAEVVEQSLRALGLRGAVLAGEKGSPILVGKPVLREPAPMRSDVALLPRPDAFLQANASASEQLVRMALEELRLAPDARVIELFCGIGTLTFAVAARAAQVCAIDDSPVALECARSSAAGGGVRNVRFILGDALKVARGLAKEGQRFDCALLDPPRTGARGVGAVARDLGVGRIVYVSCDAASLARDAADLLKHGFQPRSLGLVDMFPQTRHLEAVMAFERGGLDSVLAAGEGS